MTEPGKANLDNNAVDAAEASCRRRPGNGIQARRASFHLLAQTVDFIVESAAMLTFEDDGLDRLRFCTVNARPGCCPYFSPV
jgi:hypothetical protein